MTRRFRDDHHRPPVLCACHPRRGGARPVERRLCRRRPDGDAAVGAGHAAAGGRRHPAADHDGAGRRRALGLPQGLERAHPGDHAAGRPPRRRRRLAPGGAYFGCRGARADRRHHHLLRALLLDRPEADGARGRPAGRDQRRAVGRHVRLYLHALPGRRAAVSDVRAGAEAHQDELRRHHRVLLRHHQRAQGRSPISRSASSPPRAWAPRWCCCRSPC